MNDTANPKQSLKRLYLIVPPYYLTYRLFKPTVAVTIIEQMWQGFLFLILMGFGGYAAKILFDLLDLLILKTKVIESRDYLVIVRRIAGLMTAFFLPVVTDWMLFEAGFVDDIVYYRH
jgi:hypothetical protein